ncbi:alpha/beta fold hydrolase [Herbiconiux sp. UC225_62]|uniref:alpha/beta fold hydrolase n=1 Tax=Herbiconiux sp. UC225_62 TaxID=3350168 RepID=UPI0036D24D68
MATTEAVPDFATIPDVSHHAFASGDATIHYVTAGSGGSPIVLVHGWPETWWAFRAVIPLLAPSHRVVAVDLRGFGDSSASEDDYSPQASAEDLHRLVEHLGYGPVHLAAQDVSGALAIRFAASHPDDVLSYIGTETTFPGYGMEMLADVNNGGSWHLGFYGTPGIPEMLLPGHERAVLEWAYSVMGADPASVTEADFDEFERTYARPHAERGAAGLYQSLFTDKGALRELLQQHPLTVPVLAIDGPNHPFTEMTLRQVSDDVTAVHIDGVGHFVAQQAPRAFAAAISEFTSRVDAR